MRYDAEHKARTRQQILAEASAAIRANGPAGVSVADIMAPLGLTHGGFYAHFDSKDDLIAQSIGYMFEQMGTRFDRVTEGLAPREALAAYVGYYLSAAHRDAPGRGCALAALASDLPRLPEAARQAFGEGLNRLTARLAGLLVRLGQTDAELKARSAISELIGALAMARAVADPALSESLLRVSRESLLARLAGPPTP